MLAASLGAAPTLEMRGELGQSAKEGTPPVGWTGAAWCVNDKDGNVYLPGGWMVPAGKTDAERMSASVSGDLLTDGRDIYAWTQGNATIRRLEVVPGGLKKTGFSFRLDDRKYDLSFVPAGLEKGFGARAKLLALDRGSKEVRAWDAEGRPLGAVFKFADKVAKPKLVHSAGVHPETGDMLLGFYWPESKVRRFSPEGVEMLDGVWPVSFMCVGIQPVVGGGTWFLGGSARKLSDSYAKTISLGWNSHGVRGVARGTDGWWLATTQGAQYFPDSARRGAPPAKRVGGLAGVNALAISHGFVIAFADYSMYGMWLDDLPDEPLSRDQNWTVGGKWSGRVKSVDVTPDGRFLIAWTNGKSDETWSFDPRVTDWKDRAKRMYRTSEPPPARALNEARVGRWRAVAGGGEIALFDGAEKVASIASDATVLAADGRWIVAYSPSRKAVVRLVVGGNDESDRIAAAPRSLR